MASTPKPSALHAEKVELLACLIARKHLINALAEMHPYDLAKDIPEISGDGEVTLLEQLLWLEPGEFTSPLWLRSQTFRLPRRNRGHAAVDGNQNHEIPGDFAPRTTLGPPRPHRVPEDES